MTVVRAIVILMIVVLLIMVMIISSNNNTTNHDSNDDNSNSNYDSTATASRKGPVGSALTGSLRISCFMTEGLFGVLMLSYFYLPKSARAYLFPQSVKINYFCSSPISVDHICPQPMTD